MRAMEALPLEPDGASGTYKLIGGRLALDFINTVSWAGTDREHDWLSSTANVADWCAAVGIEVGRLANDELPAIRQLRHDLTQAIRPLAHGEHPRTAAIDTMNDRMAIVHRLRRIDADALDWVWEGQSSAVDWFAPVVLDAAEVLTGARRDRLKHCPSCDWLFEDQTRNGRRRWCDMADCGSRAKSRDYYYRTRS